MDTIERKLRILQENAVGYSHLALNALEITFPIILRSQLPY